MSIPSSDRWGPRSFWNFCVPHLGGCNLKIPICSAQWAVRAEICGTEAILWQLQDSTSVSTETGTDSPKSRWSVGWLSNNNAEHLNLKFFTSLLLKLFPFLQHTRWGSRQSRLLWRCGRALGFPGGRTELSPDPRSRWPYALLSAQRVNLSPWLLHKPVPLFIW